MDDEQVQGTTLGSAVAYLKVDEFAGGMTDFPVGAPKNKFQLADNLLIDLDKKLKLRPGVIYIFPGSSYAQLSQIPAGVQRIGGMVEYYNPGTGTNAVDWLLFASGNSLYYFGVSAGQVPLQNTYRTATGPTSNNPFFLNLIAGIQNDKQHYGFSIWQNHIYPSCDLAQSTVNVPPAPVMLYPDDSVANQLQLRTLGYPAPQSSNPAQLRVIDVVNNGTPAGTGTYLYRVFFSYQYSINGVIYLEQGPTDLLSIGSLDPKTLATHKINLYFDQTGSNVVPSNLATENYDWVNIKVNIYRTVLNGQDFYFVGTVTNPATMVVGTPFQDAVTDAALTSNALIYTAGGRVENDRASLFRYSVVVDDTLWTGYVNDFAHNSDPTQYITYPNRIRQSIPGAPFAMPGDFFLDFLEPIVGMGTIYSYPIVCTPTHVYRVEGKRDTLGRGTLQRKEISRNNGSLNHNGIINTPMGVFYPGLDGFYWTDGFRNQKISRGLEKSYMKILTAPNSATQNAPANISGTYDAVRELLVWSVQLKAESNGQNDTLFVMHLRYGIKEDSVFTTWTFAGNIFPTAIYATAYLGLISPQPANPFMITDRRGFVFWLDSNLYTDCRVDVINAPYNANQSYINNWQTKSIIYDYIGPSSDCGSENYRKYSAQVMCSIIANTNFATQLKSCNDNTGFFQPLKEMRYDEAMTWGDLQIPYGSTRFNYPWGVSPTIPFKRRFPSHHLRFDHKQIEVTNSYTNVYNSDTYGLATVALLGAGPTKTVTLPPSTGHPWVNGAIFDLLDYSISFELDGYVNNYPINKVDLAMSNYFQVQDFNNTAPTGANLKWVIRGYRKGDYFKLDEYAVMYMVMSKSQKQFRGTVGANQ